MKTDAPRQSDKFKAAARELACGESKGGRDGRVRRLAGQDLNELPRG